MKRKILFGGLKSVYLNIKCMMKQFDGTEEGEPVNVPVVLGGNAPLRMLGTKGMGFPWVTKIEGYQSRGFLDVLPGGGPNWLDPRFYHVAHAFDIVAAYIHKHKLGLPGAKKKQIQFIVSFFVTEGDTSPPAKEPGAGWGVGDKPMPEEAKEAPPKDQVHFQYTIIFEGGEGGGIYRVVEYEDGKKDKAYLLKEVTKSVCAGDEDPEPKVFLENLTFDYSGVKLW